MLLLDCIVTPEEVELAFPDKQRRGVLTRNRRAVYGVGCIMQMITSVRGRVLSTAASLKRLAVFACQRYTGRCYPLHKFSAAKEVC